MAVFWSAKDPDAAVSLAWAPNLANGDTLAGFAYSVTGAVVDAAEMADDLVGFVISGGTASQTAIIEASATTGYGETLSETIYLPIIAPGSSALSARDLASFALRKVNGIGEVPSDEQAADAIERLQDMLAHWRNTGADVGTPHPLTVNSVIYAPDEHLLAIKNNLILEIADIYGFDPSPFVIKNALQGLASVKNGNVPDDRGTEYF